VPEIVPANLIGTVRVLNLCNKSLYKNVYSLLILIIYTNPTILFLKSFLNKVKTLIVAVIC